MLTEKDRWVGEALSSALAAYECWTALLRGEINIEPESSPTNPLIARYANVFTSYSKENFCGLCLYSTVGFSKWKKKGYKRRPSLVAWLN